LRAARDQSSEGVTAAPPMIVMNSRRLMLAPSSGDIIVSARTSTLIRAETGFEHRFVERG